MTYGRLPGETRIEPSRISSVPAIRPDMKTAQALAHTIGEKYRYKNERLFIYRDFSLPGERWAVMFREFREVE